MNTLKRINPPVQLLKSFAEQRLRLISIAALIFAIAAIAMFALHYGAKTSQAAPTELFFSEYIEGSSNNKALEIYNGTGAAVDLAANAYKVEMYFNGSTSVGLTINLTGTVANNGVFVVAPTNAGATILAAANQTFGTAWFNGDDAVVLRKGTAIVDVIGQIGFDPGTEWGTGLVSTQDNTLRRKATVCQGDTDGSNAFDPSVEWDGFATDTFAGLGSHTANCAMGNQPITPTCPAILVTDEGAATSGNVSATDADGTVTSAAITNIAPSNPGTITLTGFSPAGGVGGTATATLSVGATTPAGVYTVTITWSNNDSPTPQTATCNVMVTVNSLTPTLIHDIQGSGETPNFAGQNRVIEGIVVGDFQGVSNLNGFFVEEEQSDWDANANTSEGILVFAPSAIDVSVGDKVRVTGTVTNFPSTPGLTELTSVSSVTVISSGNPLPPAQNVALPVPTSPAADLEKFEGMLVTMANLVVSDNLDLGQFGELCLAGSKLFIPTNSIDPNDDPASGNSTSGSGNVTAVTAQQTLNNNSRIILNDGKTGSNPNPIPFIGVGANATIRLGDTVATLSGILSFGFGSYRIEPTAAVAFTAANPRPATPDSVGGSLKVASFNLENFFFTLGTGRGADNVAERDRQRDKLAAAIAGLNADVVGLIELEKGTAITPDAAVNELLSKLNTLGVGTYAAVPTPAAVYDPTNPVGTDTEIKSGMIYRTSTVTAVGNSLTDTAAALGTYSRAPIAQTFQSNANGAKFTVVVNHFRSKSCAGASGADQDQGDGQSCFNARRRSQAQALVSFINNTLVPIDPDVAAIGDFNAYGQEDPIDVLRAAGLTDQIGQFVSAASRYSFTFQCQVGQLDHALTTASFNSQITGATVWHINADEPEVFDYNTENKPDDRYAATPFRSADHDPVLIGLSLACPQITIEPVTLPSGTTTAFYFQALTATGGTAPYSFVVNSGSLPGGVFLRGDGLISGQPIAVGTFNFTVTVTGAGGCTGSREYALTIGCATINLNSRNLPDGLVGAPYREVIFAGAGVIPTNFSLVAGTLPPGLELVPITGLSSVLINGTPTQAGRFNFTLKASDRNNCMGTGEFTIVVQGATSPVSDQRAGSVLIYNLYTSSTDPNRQNTRISITNIEPTRAAFVHLFFVDGATCGVADSFICLTANQTASFLASDLDPGTTGYIVAVAVDRTGCPVDFNFLIGDEYVKFASGHAANLGAEVVAAIAGGLPVCNENSTTAELAFDGKSYSVLPHALALDNVGSRADGNDTLLILNRIGGNLATGAATLGSIFGLLYDDAENTFSFTFSSGACQFRAPVGPSGFPRTTPRFDGVIPAGRSGWMKLWIASETAAMTGAAINFNANAAASAGAFNQGHNLHVLTTTNAMVYTIPIFPPSC